MGSETLIVIMHRDVATVCAYSNYHHVLTWQYSSTDMETEHGAKFIPKHLPFELSKRQIWEEVCRLRLIYFIHAEVYQFKRICEFYIR
jgi:hypothetical protein